MRTARVFTNLTCNQNCTYCTSRAAADDRRFVESSAVRGRIDEAIAAGAREIVLTGGEPALRRDLVSLVLHARAKGAESIVVETNATTLGDAMARELAEAGLSLARVNVSGWGRPLDLLTRDPGGFERTLGGLRALAGAGVPIELSVAVVRASLRELATLPAELARALGDARRCRGIVVSVPVESPDPTVLVSYEEAVPAILELEASARGVGIPVRLGPDSGPPPCVFPKRVRAAHLFSLTAGAKLRADFEKLAACGACQVADRCSGIARAYLARRAPPPLDPIDDDRMRRRLSLVSTVEAQIRREMVTSNLVTLPDGKPLEERVIRVNFHCNQSCRFCFVSTHLPPPEDVAVREAIREAGRSDVRIVLSGGEPTLNAALVEYVVLAKQVSRWPVELQTNAVLLDDQALLDQLVAAGLDHTFVSLHGSTAEISDAVTGAPGTFARTVVGVDNLARTSLRLILNFVICQANHRDVAAFVRLVADRWPTAWVNLSFAAASTDVVPRDRQLVPRYSDAMPEIAAALAEGEARGISIMGFESMCGVPLCLVPADLARYFEMSVVPDGFDGGEFTRPPACEGCALDKRCYGLRRGYAELYGVDELRRVVRA